MVDVKDGSTWNLPLVHEGRVYVELCPSQEVAHGCCLGDSKIIYATCKVSAHCGFLLEKEASVHST